MRKVYASLLALFCCAVFTPKSQAQNNNLQPGDLLITSYQSDLDPTNASSTREDRFSLLVARTGGIPAGTVIYITDGGWSSSTNTWISATEGFLKWTVPSTIAQGTEVFFISTYLAPATNWACYTTEAGTTTLGTVTTESGTNYMSLSTAGDQVIVYQTGPTAGPAAAYNNGTIRFITALHANVQASATTYTSWDGTAPTGSNQSSIPTGLVNGSTAFLMSTAALPVTTLVGTEELDNGRYNCAAGTTACSPAALASMIYNSANWILDNNVFAQGLSSSSCTYSIISPVSIGTQPTALTQCAGANASFTVTATGATGYSWQVANDAAFTSPTTITNTGVYSGATTATLNISDNTGLGGKYYRAVVSNSCGSVNSSGVMLTVNPANMPAAGATATQTVGTGGSSFFNGSCGVIAKIVPSGAQPVSGSVTTQVWMESGVPTYGGGPYVARHYQITPATNAASATATVTLYFTQAEFTAFNSAAISWNQLPTNGSDVSGKANIRIAKYAGSSSNGTGLPSSYSGSVTIIDPADANIVYNATYARWEVTFDVAGFSGFILQSSNFPLPLTLESFAGKYQGSDVVLSWKTSQETATSHFEVERSVNGVNFQTTGRQNALNGSAAHLYSYTDMAAAANGKKLYYRLKMVSADGKVTYSSVIVLSKETSGAFVSRVSPNPFKDQIRLEMQMPTSGTVNVRLQDMAGRMLIAETFNAAEGFSTHVLAGTANLKPGAYLLQATWQGKQLTFKIVK